MPRIPVTIITGFLGSGKTTLLNLILEAAQSKQINKRIAVIENEFAAAFGIENEIIYKDKAVDVKSLYEFGWGCVCCSTSGELINALVEIIQENDLAVDPIDHIILETTGLADPGPILQMIQGGADGKGQDEIAQHFYVDGIITMVDAKHYFARYRVSNEQYKNEPLAQVETTDCVIINKTDLVSDNELKELCGFIEARAPASAKLLTTQYANVSIPSLFGFREENHGSEQEVKPVKKHDPTVDQTMLLVKGMVDEQKVLDFIHKETVALQDSIYRIKGILAVAGSDKKKIVQGVGENIIISEHQPWDEDEARDTRLTFIGNNMRQHGDRLQDGLEACCISIS